MPTISWVIDEVTISSQKKRRADCSCVIRNEGEVHPLRSVNFFATPKQSVSFHASHCKLMFSCLLICWHTLNAFTSRMIFFSQVTFCCRYFLIKVFLGFLSMMKSKFDELRKQDKQKSKEDKANNEKAASTEQRSQWYLEACKLVLSPLIETVKILHAPKVWDEIRLDNEPKEYL